MSRYVCVWVCVYYPLFVQYCCPSTHVFFNIYVCLSVCLFLSFASLASITTDYLDTHISIHSLLLSLSTSLPNKLHLPSLCICTHTHTHTCQFSFTQWHIYIYIYIYISPRTHTDTHTCQLSSALLLIHAHSKRETSRAHI